MNKLRLSGSETLIIKPFADLDVVLENTEIKYSSDGKWIQGNNVYLSEKDKIDQLLININLTLSHQEIESLKETEIVIIFKDKISKNYKILHQSQLKLDTTSTVIDLTEKLHSAYYLNSPIIEIHIFNPNDSSRRKLAKKEFSLHYNIADNIDISPILKNPEEFEEYGFGKDTMIAIYFKSSDFDLELIDIFEVWINQEYEQNYYNLFSSKNELSKKQIVQSIYQTIFTKILTEAARDEKWESNLARTILKILQNRFSLDETEIISMVKNNNNFHSIVSSWAFQISELPIEIKKS